jgi:predicted nucleotide-binding protein (sugar kinase/HSP70/actin superfamily)
MITVAGNNVPFGGSCNKYYNKSRRISADSVKLDIVKKRQQLVYDVFAAPPPRTPIGTVGINRSFLTNTFFPLYSTFFAELGYRVVLSEDVDPAGIDRSRAELCFPAEIAHGAFESLLSLKPDVIFMPKLFSLPVDGDRGDRKFQSTCLLLMSEAYWLTAAFKQGSSLPRLISPQIDWHLGLPSAQKIFAKTAQELGKKKSTGEAAYQKAVEQQKACVHAIKTLGREALEEIEQNPETSAVVLFGRAYNTFA